MSILAGIFCKSSKEIIQDSLCESLRQLMSRNPHDDVMTYRDNSCFLAKIDVGAYKQPAFHTEDSGSVSMLAGEPILHLNNKDVLRTRKDDIEVLHRLWDKGDWNDLELAQGSFCAVHYLPHVRRLSLISDKLGLRPFYYWAGEEYIVFSTAIRILEALPNITKKMDLRSVTEMASLGYVLSNRTPYVNIYRLGAAEIIQFCENNTSTQRYWQWDKILQSSKSESKMLDDVYTSFTTAVVNRLKADTSTFCLLSGGLDSRCVTASLRSRNVSVHTLNYGKPGTQDLVFGNMFARAIGSIHEEIERRPSSNNGFQELTDTIAAWRLSNQNEISIIERPSLVWTGLGGSVGLGHVYLDEHIVNYMRSGKREAAVELYISRQQITVQKRLLNKKILNPLSDILKVGILEDLNKIHCDDPARDFYLFLMLDEQRCLLSTYYEDIDIYRLEFHVPLLDSNFLTSIMQVPIDLCLKHHFYNKLLKHFPEAVTSVPWQAYPGHEPCPLPIPYDLAYQWNDKSPKPVDPAIKIESLRLALELLKAKEFPHPVINRWHLYLATWLYRYGLKDYSYLIKVADVYYRFWLKSGGRYELSL